MLIKPGMASQPQVVFASPAIASPHVPHPQLGLGDRYERGSQAGQMGSALPRVILDNWAVDVCAGFRHTCAILKGGVLKCWGANLFGGLGQVGFGFVCYGMTGGRGEWGWGRWVRFCVYVCRYRKFLAPHNILQGDQVDRGDNEGEMGSLLPPIDVGGAVQSVSCGKDNT